MTIHDSHDLRARIAELAESTPDPAVVTRTIVREVTGEEALVIAALTLHNYVRLQMTARREPSDQQLYETATGKTRSAFVAGVRSLIDEELHRSVCVDDHARVYKRLSDCDETDLLKAASSRKKAARRLEHRADVFLKTAIALREHKVSTVKELPLQVLEGLLG